MSVAARLVGFFVAPAHAAAPCAGEETGSGRSSPVEPSPAAVPGCEGPAAGAAVTSPAAAVDGAADRPMDPRRSACAFANGTDGTAARRLEPAPEPERRAVLRLVPAETRAEPLAPDTSPSTTPAVSGSADPGVGTRLARAAGAARPRDAPRREGSAPRVCVLGDGRAAAVLSRALASRLSQGPAARCAVHCRLPSIAPGRPAAGPAFPRPAARRLARRLTADGLTVVARGRLVELVLQPPADLGAELERISGWVVGVPVVTALPAARAPELDPLLAGHDLVLLAVGASAPDALTDLALTGLQRAAPGAEVRSVTLPTRFGPGALRAAVDAALEALR